VSLSLAEKGRSCVWELREEKKIAGGGRLQTKKTIGERGRWLGFGQEKKIRFRFFYGCPKFLSLKKICPL